MVMAIYQIYPASQTSKFCCLWLRKDGQLTNIVQFNDKFALIGRLLSHYPVHMGGFKTVVARAWRNQPPQMIIDVGNNTFLFIFGNEEDKDIVKNTGPWWFMDSHLVLKDCPRDVCTNRMDFSTTTFWVQAHNIPFEKRSEKRAAKIGRVFPQVHSVEVGEAGSKAWDGFVRLLVDIDLTQPLVKGMLLKSRAMDPLWIQFKYERMPFFCENCGMLGHKDDHCLQRRVGSLEIYGSELRALPRFGPSLLPSWNTLKSYMLTESIASDNAASGSHIWGRRFTKIFMMEVSDDDDDVSENPLAVHVPSLAVNAFSSHEQKGSYETFDSQVHGIGDYDSPPLPQLPVRQPYPEHPTEEEWSYIERMSLTEEEYKDYKADLEWVPEGGDDDESRREVVKVYLDVEHLAKRNIDSLIEGDRAWFQEAREFLKVHLQKWAFPVETGVWDITLVGQFERPVLMEALFK